MTAAKSIFGGAPIARSNRHQNINAPYRRSGGRGVVRVRLSMVLAFVFIAVMLILVGIYIYYNDVKMPVVLSIDNGYFFWERI